MLAGRRIVNRFRHRADHITWKIRLDAGHQCAGNYRAGHDLVRRCRKLQVAGIAGFCDTGLQERLLLLLPVLHGCRIEGLRSRRSWTTSQRIEARQCCCIRGRLCRRSHGWSLTASAEEHR
ncbi:hypothetical protein D9M70_496800 [compost metagenome]